MEKTPGYNFIADVPDGTHIAAIGDRLVVCEPGKEPYMLTQDGKREPVQIDARLVWTQDQDPNSFEPIHNAIRKTK